MTDLVTGATGFIGGHLAERLVATGRRVRVLCRRGSEPRLPRSLASDRASSDGASSDRASSIEIAIGDLTDEASLVRATEGVERVFHCAAQVLDWGPSQVFEEANVRGTTWLLRASRAAGVRRFVHFSSIAVFGTPSPPYFDDASPFGDGRDAYTKTKVRSEEAVAPFVAEGMDVVVLRPAVVYGPRGTWLEQPLAMIEQGKMALLGGGRGTCHPCYIENLVDAALLAAEHPAAKGRAYIVGDDDPITFKQYFDAVAALADRPPITRSVPLALARAVAVGMEAGAKAVRASGRPLLTRTAIDMVTTESRMSMARIKEELGFAPRYDFPRAMAELRAWYREERAGGAPR